MSDKLKRLFFRKDVFMESAQIVFTQIHMIRTRMDALNVMDHMVVTINQAIEIGVFITNNCVCTQ